MSDTGEWLTAEEGIAKLDQDPESVWWPIDHFSLQIGLTFEDIRAECAAGRLEMKGIPMPEGGWRDCIITAGSFIRWQANRRTPKRLLRKVRAHLKGPTQ